MFLAIRFFDDTLTLPIFANIFWRQSSAALPYGDTVWKHTGLVE